MFMDDALQIKPSDLDMVLDNRLNLFTMEHESQYGPLINELIEIFIPPDIRSGRNGDSQTEHGKICRLPDVSFLRYAAAHQNRDEVLKIRLIR